MFNKKYKQIIKDLEFEVNVSNMTIKDAEKEVEKLKSIIEKLEKENKQLKKKLGNNYKGGTK